jgi:hypothetical protein
MIGPEILGIPRRFSRFIWQSVMESHWTYRPLSLFHQLLDEFVFAWDHFEIQLDIWDVLCC